MRLSNFLVAVAVAAGLLAIGDAFSAADDAKVSRMSSPDSVQHYGGESKRGLRIVDDVDGEERFKDPKRWFNLADRAWKAEGTEKTALLAALDVKFASKYRKGKWEEALDAHDYAIAKKVSEKKAMRFGILFGDYVERANGNL